MTLVERPLPDPIPYTADTPWRGVLHTTESSTTSTYDGGAVAPQLTVSVQDRKTWRHYDYRKFAGKALKHPPGTPATNTTRCVQIEVIGFCDPVKASSPLHISKWTDEDYAYLNSVMRQIESDVGIARRSSVSFKAYPASYGTSNGVRLGWNAWADYSGWLGHQHVPGNVHGDPGNLDIHALLYVPPTPKKVPEMQWLARTRGLSALYLCTGSTIRWVQDTRQLASITERMKHFGFDPDDVAEYGPGELDGGIAGVLIGAQAPDGTH